MIINIINVNIPACNVLRGELLWSKGLRLISDFSPGGVVEEVG